MRHTPALQLESSSHVGLRGNRNRWLTLGVLGAVLVGLGGGGCGAGTEAAEAPEVLGTHRAAEYSGNGLSTNGLSTNGLSTNGLSTNGLSTNGLSTNGFMAWFDQSPDSAASLMSYVVRCAMAAGQTLSFTSSATGVTYSWTGSLGLAPGWASGQPATQLEQQVVSACLAAHTNKYGIQIPISVLGRDAQGTPIPYSAQELATYSEPEACFFGNLFDGSGIFAANDHAYLTSQQSTARACGLSSSAGQSDCPPLVHVGTCESRCTRAPGASGAEPYYSECSYNGRTYRPLTTRIRPQEIYSCGDGTCQFTERCGTSNTYDSCQADCGTCS